MAGAKFGIEPNEPVLFLMKILTVRTLEEDGKEHGAHAATQKNLDYIGIFSLVSSPSIPSSPRLFVPMAVGPTHPPSLSKENVNTTIPTHLTLTVDSLTSHPPFLRPPLPLRPQPND